MTKPGPRILYSLIFGPSENTPTAATAKPSAASRPANSRGAVPGPKAKPRCPGRSAEATSASVAISAITAPP